MEAATTVVTAWKDAVKREAGSGDLRRGSSGVSEPQLSVSLRRGSVASQDSLQGSGKEAANGVTPSSRAPVCNSKRGGLLRRVDMVPSSRGLHTSNTGSTWKIQCGGALFDFDSTWDLTWRILLLPAETSGRVRRRRPSAAGARRRGREAQPRPAGAQSPAAQQARRNATQQGPQRAGHAAAKDGRRAARQDAGASHGCAGAGAGRRARWPARCGPWVEQ